MYKLVKKSKNKIKCVRDENTGEEVYPEDIGLSDNFTKVNYEMLCESLYRKINPEKPVKLFDILNDINQHKLGIVKGNESAYAPFIINKMLSLSVDCLHQANEMNMRPNLPPLIQYKYLSNSIRAKKRFSKVPKFDTDKDVLIIAKLHNLSERKAKQILDVVRLEVDELPDNYKTLYKQL